MNFIDRWLGNLAIRRLEGRMSSFWGTNWKGKTGAVLGGLAAVFGLGRDFVAGTLTADQATIYFAAIGMALSLFGIRQAQGPSIVTPSKE